VIAMTAVPRRRVAVIAAAFVIALVAAAGAPPSARADEPQPAADAAATVRVATLKFGTVEWEIDVIRRHGLDRAHGIRVDPVDFAGAQAAQVALQGGRVDTAVLDWLWVSRQRAAGADWTFAPFSSAVGSVVVPAASPIRSVADLRGKRLGVAGSPLDKGWLILRLLTLRNDGFDLDAAAEKSFGAPPLLSEQLAGGRLDAVLTYWPYAARLEAQGMRGLVSIGDALRELGMPDDLPMIGYVFSEQWAAANRAAADGFLKASRDAKRILAASDEEWRTIMPLTGAKDEAELARLRDAFRAGIPKEQASAAAEQEAAGKLYALLASLGGEALVGPSPTLRPGTFYPMPSD